MAVVGDRIELLPSKAGQLPRPGVVTAISGVLMTVRWDTGEETKFVPGPGVLSIVEGGGRTPAMSTRPRAARSTASRPSGQTAKKGTTVKKTAPTAKATKSATTMKSASAPKKKAGAASQSEQRKAKRNKGKGKGKKRKK